MSGFSYGVIEVTQGADDANATPRSQVAAMIAAYVANAHSYAGVELSSFGSAQALTASIYAALNAGTGSTYTGMLPTSDFSVNLSTGAITYIGTDTKRFKVTFMGSVETDTISNGMLTAIFKNGSQASNAFFVSLPVVAQVYPIMIQQIVELATNDVVQPYVAAAVNSNSRCHGYALTVNQA